MPVSSKVFRKYPNQVLVETGSFRGDGIAAALNAGFPKVISIEVFRPNLDHCKQRFRDDPRVDLRFGSSRDLLSDVITPIDVPITFWLDAHYSGDGTGMDGAVNPIEAELAAIRCHHLKTHTILIDDRRQFGTPDFLGVTEQRLKQLLHNINPNYRFAYRDGHQENDILVAYLPTGFSQKLLAYLCP